MACCDWLSSRIGLHKHIVIVRERTSKKNLFCATPEEIRQVKCLQQNILYAQTCHSSVIFGTDLARESQKSRERITLLSVQIRSYTTQILWCSFCEYEITIFFFFYSFADWKLHLQIPKCSSVSSELHL